MGREFPRRLLRVGYRPPGSLCDKRGAVVIQAGVELTETLFARNRVAFQEGLLIGSDWTKTMLAGVFPRRPAKAEGGNRKPHRLTVRVDMLREGTRLSQSLYDEAGVLLLAAGSEITSPFLGLLKNRRIEVVRLLPACPCTAGVPAESGEGQAEHALACELSRCGNVFRASAPTEPARLPLEELSRQANVGLAKHAEASTALVSSYRTLLGGGMAACDEAASFAEEFLESLAVDGDLLPTIVAMQQGADEYLYDHAVNVALMGVTIGSRLGLNRDQLIEVGLGAFFHDAGMLRVPDEIRLAKRPLTETEWALVRQHPVYTFEHLQNVRGFPASAAMIGYQAHERCDGSGYPHGHLASTIHPYAKIVAVADTFTALTRPRPFREALLPHDAVRRILADGSEGRYDRRVLRALLDCLSAYPIGSCVMLKKGIIAKVLRANPNEHTRPVVVALDSDGSPTDWVIDLAKEKKLKVMQAVAGPEVAVAKV